MVALPRPKETRLSLRWGWGPGRESIQGGSSDLAGGGGCGLATMALKERVQASLSGQGVPEELCNGSVAVSASALPKMCEGVS